MSLEPIVKSCAKSVRSFTGAELEELISAGWIGACQAVDSFEPSRNVPLTVHARTRIRGAMLDALRQADPLTRGQRKRGMKVYHVPLDEFHEKALTIKR